VDLVFVLEWLAEVRARGAVRHARRDQLIAATRLFGAATALRDGLGAAASRSWAIPLAPPNRDAYERQLAATRVALGAQAFEVALAEGRRLAVEHAIAEALAAPPVADRTAAH
jgi:hypothetical protein